MVRRSINYEPFPIEQVEINKLILDSANVRIPDYIQGKDRQQALLSYLINSEDVLSLVRSFLTEDYIDIEYPVVIKDNGKYVVLEGNRRVSALKVLCDPTSAGEKEQEIRNQLETTDIQWNIRAINVQICPSREAFARTLARIHTKQSKKSWPRDQIAQFYYEKIKDDPNLTLIELKKTYPSNDKSIEKFVRIKSLRNEILTRREEYAQFGYSSLGYNISQNFSYTPFEYAYTAAAKILQLEFDKSRGIVKTLTNEQFRGLLEIAQMVCNKEFNTRKRPSDFEERIRQAMEGRESIQNETLNSQHISEQLPTDTQSLQQNEQEDINTEHITTHKKLTRPHGKFLKTEDLLKVLEKTSITRVDTVKVRVQDLGLLPYKDHLYSSILLIRNILEIFLQVFAQEKNIERCPGSLEGQLNKTERWVKKQESIDKKTKTILVGQLLELQDKQKKGSRSTPLPETIYGLHAVNHDPSYEVIPDNVKDIWTKVHALIHKLLETVS